MLRYLWLKTQCHNTRLLTTSKHILHPNYYFQKRDIFTFLNINYNKNTLNNITGLFHKRFAIIIYDCKLRFTLQRTLRL